MKFSYLQILLLIIMTGCESINLKPELSAAFSTELLGEGVVKLIPENDSFTTAEVDWGDGNIEKLSAFNETTHIYQKDGSYSITFNVFSKNRKAQDASIGAVMIQNTRGILAVVLKTPINDEYVNIYVDNVLWTSAKYYYTGSGDLGCDEVAKIKAAGELKDIPTGMHSIRAQSMPKGYHAWSGEVEVLNDLCTIRFLE